MLTNKKRGCEGLEFVGEKEKRIWRFTICKRRLKKRVVGGEKFVQE